MTTIHSKAKFNKVKYSQIARAIAHAIARANTRAIARTIASAIRRSIVCAIVPGVACAINSVIVGMQWRSQGHCFGGANAEGVSHSRGVRGHAPPENFKI